MKKNVFLYCFICFLVFSCSKDDDDKDMEKPTIDMSYQEAYPQNCVTLYRGESFSFRAIFRDNRELGNYNIEIHNNFDHHSHSTDNVECELETKKIPVNPFVYNQDFSIPSSKVEFEANQQIAIPQDIEAGDYHLMIRVTDKAGWQQLKALSLKIGDR